MFRNHLARWILGKNRSLPTSQSDLKVITNDFIGDEVLCYGRYESTEIQLLSTLFDFETKHVDALDIGANIGNHAVPLADLFKRVLAFEPHPLSSQLLKINCSTLTNISVFPFGLSDSNIKTFLNYSEMNYGKASMVNKQKQSIEVELKKGDAVVDSIVGFVKIDVEGYELTVLRGLRNTIQKNLPIIAFEFNPTYKNHKELMQLFKELGYTEFYKPYKKSFFPKDRKRRFYQSIIDDLFFKSTSKLVRLNPISKNFLNLVFTEAPSSKFRIKREQIRN